MTQEVLARFALSPQGPNHFSGQRPRRDSLILREPSHSEALPLQLSRLNAIPDQGVGTLAGRAGVVPHEIGKRLTTQGPVACGVHHCLRCQLISG